MLGKLRELWAAQRERPPLARWRALTSFFGAAALLGLGFAMVDQTQSGSDPFYYYGFAVAFLGILTLFTSSEEALFRPLWLFGLSFLVEIYGSWNLFWTIFDVAKCQGCNLGSSVILAYLGALWPWNNGSVIISLGGFVATTAAALVGPILVAHLVPRDVVVRSSQES